MKTLDKGKEMSRADKLAKLRDKMSKTDMSVGSAGFLRLQDGRNVIRILPEVKSMEYFFQTVGKHALPPDQKKWFYCPKFTSEGKLDCPICDYVDELYKAGDKSSKKLANELRVKRMFWMNVIDRENEKAGPLIYTPGVTVFGQISSLINDPDYGDIFDAKDGIDIVVEKSGKGYDTEYNIKTRRNSTLLSDDPELVDKWLDDARDLTFIEVSDDKDEDAELSKGHAVYILPFERMEREFEELSDSDDDDDDDDVPVKKTSLSKKSVKEEDEEEDDTPHTRKVTKRVVPDNDDDDDDDDDVLPVKTPKKKVDEDNWKDLIDDDDLDKSKKKVAIPDDDEEEEEDDVEKELASRRMARRRLSR
jgi:hypothetical protein